MEITKDIKKKLGLLPKFISIKLTSGIRQNYELYVHENNGHQMVGYYPYKSVDSVDYTDIFFLDDRFEEPISIKPNTSKETLRKAYDRMVTLFEHCDIVAIEAKEVKRQSDIFLNELCGL